MAVFDAVGKDLVEFSPAGWVTFLDHPRPADRVQVIDADLSATVSTATDKVVRVDDPTPWILMIELQANWDGDLPFDLLRRYALLRHRHRLPVACVVVLLRPSADMSVMTGAFLQEHPLGGDWAFPFRVVRVWEYAADTFLDGPLGLLPLAPITAVDPDRARPVISKVADRIGREATRAQSERLWLATSILLAMRFADDDSDQLRELMSTTDLLETAYGKIAMEVGEIRHAQKVILRQGGKKFGPPAPEVEAAVKGINDLTRLNHLIDRLLDVASWQELLAR
ncbi:MAG: hypothetical protein J2P46_07770 [Zavarzinella sp.]|nr:hypothetical protein [Zavarzinella sp.]